MRLRFQVTMSILSSTVHCFFEVMVSAGNEKIYPDITKETPYIIVKVEPHSER